MRFHYSQPLLVRYAISYRSGISLQKGNRTNIDAVCLDRLSVQTCPNAIQYNTIQTTFLVRQFDGVFYSQFSISF